MAAETEGASEAIAGVGEEAAALSDEDHELVLTARVDDLTAQLEGAKGELEAVAEAADETAEATAGVGEAGAESVGSLGGAVKDILRPVGLAKAEVSDLASTFQQVTDAAVASSGISAGAIGKIASAVPYAGIAISGIAAIWKRVKDTNAAATEEAERSKAVYEGIGEALRVGKIDQALADIEQENRDLFDTALESASPTSSYPITCSG